MKISIIIVCALFLFSSSDKPVLDSKEAKSAFLYLNQVRTNPKDYEKNLPFLKNFKPTYALKWNDTLAKVAEAKALDMATRNFFAHVDPEGYGMNYYINKAGYKLKPEWMKTVDANYFESCNGGGKTGKRAIEMLLIDSGVVELGHRKHLLGIDSWSSTLYDVGIGFARRDSGSYYKTYTCVLIAKH